MLKWLGKHINIWVIAGGVVIVILLILFWLAVLWYFSPVKMSNQYSQAVITIIPAPTITQIPVTIAPTNVSQAADGQQAIDETPSIYVTVNGTGNDGLRVRSGPGTSHTIQFLADDGDVFVISDEPVDADGYTWWHIVSPDNPDINGWAASEYLTIISTP